MGFVLLQVPVGAAWEVPGRAWVCVWLRAVGRGLQAREVVWQGHTSSELLLPLWKRGRRPACASHGANTQYTHHHYRHHHHRHLEPPPQPVVSRVPPGREPFLPVRRREPPLGTPCCWWLPGPAPAPAIPPPWPLLLPLPPPLCTPPPLQLEWIPFFPPQFDDELREQKVGNWCKWWWRLWW